MKNFEDLEKFDISFYRPYT